MALPSGTRIGPYEVTAQIGVGGMGEVYRAVDSNLSRAVAIKVLPDTFARDPDRLARFEREAKTLASLNHPNIAQVFGLEKGPSTSSGQAPAIWALVMVLVEGPTLADRIAKGPIPIDEAVPIAIQIAEALESAHDHGVIHRDLKPANVKVRDDGTVKVLDFGLAKAVDSGAGSREPGTGALADSPTITNAAMTQAGVILGTAAYMSPEQAKGRVVDRRADIWAFGCVLYEMLTGTRAFAGEDISDVLVSVLRDEPAWPKLPASTPAHITALLKRCLQKDPKKRLPHIGVARLDLMEAPVAQDARATRTVSRRVIALAAAASALIGAVIGGGAIQFMQPVGKPPEPVQFEIVPAPGHVFPGAQGVPRFALSPDGTTVVYELSVPGRTASLWLRRLDTAEARPIPGVEAANDSSLQSQVWSPDSKALAFFDESNQKLKRVDPASGALANICDISGQQFGGSWNDAGVILFGSTTTGGIVQVAASGGTPTQVTKRDSDHGEFNHLFPEWLPDGRHFIYLATRSAGPSQLVLGSLNGDVNARLVESTAGARFVPPDSLVYIRDGQLVSQRLNLDARALQGPVRVIAGSVASTAAGRAGFSVSSTGVIAIASGADHVVEDAVWVDRAGRPLSDAGNPIPMAASGLRLSHRGQLVAFIESTSRDRAALTVHDVVRHISWKLSDFRLGDGTATLYAFSPDDRRVYYRAPDPGANGATGLYEQEVSGATPPIKRFEAPALQLANVSDVTPDGETLLFNQASAGTSSLRFVGLAPGGKPSDYLKVPDSRVRAAISPDGRFVAYSVASLNQVFIQPFPDAGGGKWPVSSGGARLPRWRQDGRELYFVDTASRLMAAPVTLSPRFQIGDAVHLFDLPQGRMDGSGYPFDASPDGQRFIVARPRPTTASLTVLVNWPSLSKTLAGSDAATGRD